jgi:DNA-binding NtrC family response regulator
VDVRVIAATNKDLEREVQEGQFRADLFYRLRSVNIAVPPLRRRREDIPLLTRFFVADVTRRNNVTFGGLTDEAMQVLQEYHWPGNVRELRNVVESMIVLENGRRLSAEDVRKYLKEPPAENRERNLPVPLGRTVEQAERELILRALLDIKGNLMELRNLMQDHLQTAEETRRNHHDPLDPQEPQPRDSLSLQTMEQTMIAEALKRFRGNRRVAARALNISERTLYRKIKEYGLE